MDTFMCRWWDREWWNLELTNEYVTCTCILAVVRTGGGQKWMQIMTLFNGRPVFAHATNAGKRRGWLAQSPWHPASFLEKPKTFHNTEPATQPPKTRNWTGLLISIKKKRLRSRVHGQKLQKIIGGRRFFFFRNQIMITIIDWATPPMMCTYWTNSVLFDITVFPNGCFTTDCTCTLAGFCATNRRRISSARGCTMKSTRCAWWSAACMLCLNQSWFTDHATTDCLFCRFFSKPSSAEKCPMITIVGRGHLICVRQWCREREINGER